MRALLLSLLIFFAPTLCGLVKAQTVEFIEPPFWWVGMQEKNLQLMVYGENIAKLNPIIKRNDVHLQALHRLSNPNYLFIDLILDDTSRAGELNFSFHNDNGEGVIEYTYELRNRKPNSSIREGFDNSDVLYLITPDRFANGDPSNDELDTMKEGLNRSAELGRHGGDIQGIMDHLDYIQDMGFTAIWLNPILENDQLDTSYHGYSTTDYYKVDGRFGSNEDYVELSNKASKLGIKMIMDIIVNHCGSEHLWAKDIPSDDWFNNSNGEYVQTNHRKSTLLDPYVSEVDRSRMVEGWFVPTMPDLNQRNPFVATYLIQNSIWWIEYAGLSGIRQDTYSYPYREFMTDWTCAIMKEYPSFNIVGEEWVSDPSIIAYWQAGKSNPDGNNSCLPGLMDFPMTMTLSPALREPDGSGLIRLYEMLAQDYHYPDPSKLVIFPDNHDMSRVYTQLGEDFDLFKMAIGYILTMRGIPQLYYGTEILMSNTGSNSHGIIRSDFPGGWEGDSMNGFSGEGLSQEAHKAQEFVRELLHWRKDQSVIHSGQLMHYEPQDGIYVYFRYDDSNSVMVILSSNTNEVVLNLDRFRECLSNYVIGTEIISDDSFDLSHSLLIPSKGIMIIQLE